MFQYLKNVRKETSKVVWPTKEELKTYTAVVIGVSLFFSVYFGLIDTGILALFRLAV